MRTWHPASWSKQARALAEGQYWYYYNITHDTFDYVVTDENWLKEMAKLDTYRHFFSNSYRAPIIRYRAAKHFRRLRRANKKPKENY